jgi:hypothetical protein
MYGRILTNRHAPLRVPPLCAKRDRHWRGLTTDRTVASGMIKSFARAGRTRSTIELTAVPPFPEIRQASQALAEPAGSLGNREKP